MAWQDDDGESPETFRLLRYGDKNINPLSFSYTLASEGDISKNPERRSRERRSRMYRSVTEAFGMAQEPAFDHRFIFPTPPLVNSLFHERGEGNPRLIWKLFREAVQGIESVKPDHFERALEIRATSRPENSPKLSFSSIPRISCPLR